MINNNDWLVALLLIMRRPEIVSQIAQTLRRIAPTAETILYGSEARGDAHAGSDIDLLILVDGDKLSLSQEEAITIPLYQIELATGVPVSPLVMLKSQWYNRPIKTPFYINVMNEGITL